MIETRDLWVRFGPVAAVRGLSLLAEAGGWTALIGPNGAGKTSALRALAGLAAYEGEVLIEGRDARRLGRRAVARLVAFVPQKPGRPRDGRGWRPPGRSTTSVLGGGGRDREAAQALRRSSLRLRRAVARLAQRRRLQRAVLAARSRRGSVLLLDGPVTAPDLGRQKLASSSSTPPPRRADGGDDDARSHPRRPVRRAARAPERGLGRGR
jgi:iron complex transport system ATP-binding protein